MIGGEPASPDDKSRATAEPATVLQERSFPLIALFQLATYWATIVACIDGAALGKELDAAQRWPAVAVGLTALAVLVGAALGFVVGLGQLRMWRSAWIGAGVGALYGVAILAVYVAPAPILQAAAAAGVLMATTIAFRVRSA
jgi:hypothetical protein